MPLWSIMEPLVINLHQVEWDAPSLRSKMNQSGWILMICLDVMATYSKSKQFHWNFNCLFDIEAICSRTSGRCKISRLAGVTVKNCISCASSYGQVLVAVFSSLLPSIGHGDIATMRVFKWNTPHCTPPEDWVVEEFLIDQSSHPPWKKCSPFWPGVYIYIYYILIYWIQYMQIHIWLVVSNIFYFP